MKSACVAVLLVTVLLVSQAQAGRAKKCAICPEGSVCQGRGPALWCVDCSAMTRDDEECCMVTGKKCTKAEGLGGRCNTNQDIFVDTPDGEVEGKFGPGLEKKNFPVCKVGPKKLWRTGAACRIRKTSEGLMCNYRDFS